MKVLAKYTVIEEPDGSIRVYNSLNINAPAEIAKPIVEYFTKRRR